MSARARSRARRRSGVWLVLALAATSGAGCRTRPRADAASAPSAPVDRLAPGEAAPGQDVVHGLPLPRGSTIERRFGASTYVQVPHARETLASWVRRYADGAEGVVGPHSTLFAVVHLKGADRRAHLRVEIVAGERAQSATMIIDRVDDTRPVVPSGLTNDELMKKAGLAPDGKVLDPEHRE